MTFILIDRWDVDSRIIADGRKGLHPSRLNPWFISFENTKLRGILPGIATVLMHLTILMFLVNRVFLPIGLGRQIDADGTEMTIISISAESAKCARR